MSFPQSIGKIGKLNFLKFGMTESLEDEVLQSGWPFLQKQNNCFAPRSGSRSVWEGVRTQDFILAIENGW